MHIAELGKGDMPSFRTDSAERLDRSKWLRPLVSVIVTHHNYSHHIKDALLSILDQTHENWECVVVDDCSTAVHRAAVEAIINEIGSDKIRLLPLEKNIGQTLAFYAGLDATSGEFVCLLDPDDRYAPTFLEELLKAHCNETIFCPVLCCDQRLLKNGSILSGTNIWHKMRFMEQQPTGVAEVPQTEISRLLYFHPSAEGWLWPSTSGMMFRRAGVNLARPHKPLNYKVSTDAYLAQGLHRLGGTLFLTNALVYRGVHDENSWLTPGIFATTQQQGRLHRKNYGPECLVDVIEAIRHNGGGVYLDQHITPDPKDQHVAPTSKPKLTTTRRWRRSLKKRWNRFLGRSDQLGATPSKA